MYCIVCFNFYVSSKKDFCTITICIERERPYHRKVQVHTQSYLGWLALTSRNVNIHVNGMAMNYDLFC